MIVNQKVIENVVLKNIIGKEICRIWKMVEYSQNVVLEINKKICQINEYCYQLEIVKNNCTRKHQQIYKQRLNMREQLKDKTYTKMVQQNSLINTMKQLQQNCAKIKLLKQNIINQNTKNRKYTNQIEEFTIHHQQFQLQSINLQNQNFSNKKSQNQYKVQIQQLKMYIQTKRKQISLENSLRNIIKDVIKEKQNKILQLKNQMHKRQVKIGKIREEYQRQSIETVEIKTKFIKQKNTNQKLSQLIKQKQEQILKHSQNKTLNQKTQSQINDKISHLIQQSNHLGQRIIQTRQQTLKLNIQKNTNKKINQKLKAKVRDLMKLVLSQNT